MKYVVAVSGGVDSVVLLDMLVRRGDHELVVAHFDHGIREDSAADARFVAALAEQYGLPVYIGTGELGPGASEALAREKRYEFLRELANATGGKILTAHHKDDVIETIALNLTRGTGWRGLAVLAAGDIDRPLTKFRKADLYAYAMRYKLEWVEDETNVSDVYLRNRIRKAMSSLTDSAREKLIELWTIQRKLAVLIDKEASQLVTDSRYFMTMTDDKTAIDILRIKTPSLTRPQLRRLHHAIKTAKPDTIFEAGPQTRIAFTMREFIVKHPL